MVSTEQAIKAQFAKVFTKADWVLFKKTAEFNLREAARIRTTDMVIERGMKLLARNARKRLLIGVGTELLLKAIYLRHEYAINKLATNGQAAFPFTFAQAAGPLLADKTFMLNDLISQLPRVIPLTDPIVTIRGLTIAKVFRNKEGHTVTAKHTFDPSNYSDIAAALVALYRDAFAERLSLQFAVARNEAFVWKVSAL
jgi:hypothetical protein